MKGSNPYKRLYLIIIKCNITTDVLGDTSGIQGITNPFKGLRLQSITGFAAFFVAMPFESL